MENLARKLDKYILFFSKVHGKDSWNLIGS